MSTKEAKEKKQDVKKKAFECVPYAEVSDPEVQKWRTVKYSALLNPDEAEERFKLRLFGTRAEVYQAALEHLCYVTWQETKAQHPTIDAFIAYCAEPRDAGSEFMAALFASVDSIKIGDSCPHCLR